MPVRRRQPGPLASITPGALWLFSIPSSGRLDDLADPDVDVEKWAATAFDAQLVRRHVDALPTRERVVIQLRYGLAGDAMSCRDAGSYLGWSASTVHSIEQRALQLLRGRYGLL